MGKNHIGRLGNSNIAGLALIAISVIMSIGLISSAAGFGNQYGSSSANNASSTVVGTICNVFNTIKDAIFILGLALMVLGGAVYAGANLMPSQSRGGFQGYGMAMVIGGVIGVAIAVAAPFILNTILGASGASGQFVANQSGTQGGQTGTGGIQTNVQSVCTAAGSNGFGLGNG